MATSTSVRAGGEPAPRAAVAREARGARLRILLVIPQLRIGGAEHQVALLARTLKARNHNVAVATFYAGGDLEAGLRDSGVPVHVVQKRTALGLEVIAGLRRLLVEGRYDVVHSFLFPANWRTRIAGHLARTPAVIVSTRSLEGYLGWGRLLLNRWLEPWADLVVVNADALKEHLVRDQGLPPQKMRVVRNGLELRFFEGSLSRDEARRRLGLPLDVPVLGSVGNFKPEKNQDDLIRMIVRLRETAPQARLLLVGGGQREGELRRLAAELGAGEAVVFAGESGHVSDVLPALDLFLNSSTREGCCNAILEAMAGSLPVLANAVGGNPELVEDGVTGLLFPVGACDDMARKAAELLQDPQKRRSMGAAGQRRARERFGVEENVTRTEDVYREVLEAKGKSANPAAAPSAPAELLATIIMPVRNEAAHIEECLAAVLKQDPGPGGIEVLVVDGRSKDRTREIVGEVNKRHPNVRLLDNPGGIVPTAMNIGIREARGEFIIRVDGHCVVEPGYIRSAIETLRRTGCQGVGGCMVATGGGLWARSIAKATSTPFGVGNARFHYSDQEGEADTVYLGAYPRDFLRQIGGYDPEFVRNQDDELNYRIRAGGGRVFYTPKMRAIYQVRTSLRLLFRQYFQYGLWKVPMYRKTGHRVQIRHLVPAAFVLALVLPLFVAPWWPQVLLLPAALLGAHLLTGLMLGLRAAGPTSAGFVMPLVFLTLHVSYGLGFLIGMFRPGGGSRRRAHESSVAGGQA